jgi:hypothetical protein
LKASGETLLLGLHFEFSPAGVDLGQVDVVIHEVLLCRAVGWVRVRLEVGSCV